MTMRKITVTQIAIDRGKPRNAESCPVAIAARVAGLDRAAVAPLGTVKWVLYYWKYIGGQQVRLSVDLPPTVASQVRTYDSAGFMEPFAFEVEA
jgi:hypothetical protein